MPYVLSENRSAIASTLERPGRALGLAQPGEEPVLAWVLELRRTLAIPSTLEALGVREEHLGVLAQRAAADPSAATNPLPLDVAGYDALLRPRARGRADGLSRAPFARPTAIGGQTNYVIRARFASGRAERRAGVAELVDARDLGSRG
jgi:Iron-containing alcohol dehydrogenase